MFSDHLRTGFITGLLAPVLGFLLYGLIYVNVIRPGNDLSWFVNDLFLGTPQFRSKILSLALIADVPLFFWFDRKDRHQAMRGVIGAMFLHGIVIIVLW